MNQQPPLTIVNYREKHALQLVSQLCVNIGALCTAASLSPPFLLSLVHSRPPLSPRKGESEVSEICLDYAHVWLHTMPVNRKGALAPTYGACGLQT